MDLKSGYPFWAISNGLMHAFPPLSRDMRCDVVVIGGGITGALIANELVSGGHDVIVVEQRDIGWGSSAASTALLQYEIDTPMTELAGRLGEADAALAYTACAEAIPRLGALAREVRDVGYAPKRSLYYASRRRHVAGMRGELALRCKHGLPASWLSGEELRADFGIEAPGAIFTPLAASLDPYRMANRLFIRMERSGTAVFDRTQIASIAPTSRAVTLRSADGVVLHAGHVVVAAGYASQQWLEQPVAKNRSSYAFVTDPLDREALHGLADTMVWESARPYLYMRTTSDNRLLVGGEDDAIDVPALRDARVDRKAHKLVAKVAKAMPSLQLTPAFAWGGTFAETDDGLPFFGAHPQYGPRVQFAMAYGGNGITYSMLGADLVRSLIERRSHRLASLFSFDRIQRAG
ncbi:NAD(P)/FAD-dependent oxidoreductase [Rhodanobacter ginsengiterrae]|uniref:NAD(P)/FAD-dependent oxidoreductase n=1 Tax=Rhodanobacter ginsengiterrae TaxID=2008451 RepID=UPI003CEB6BA6